MIFSKVRCRAFGVGDLSSGLAPDGQQYLDANTNQPIPKGEEHFGYKPRMSWREYQLDSANHGKTREQIIADQNGPERYHMEWKVNNESHRYE